MAELDETMLLSRLLCVTALSAWLGACSHIESAHVPENPDDDLARLESYYASRGTPLPDAEEVDRAAARNAGNVLGSQTNPIRTNMPAGQRAYLDRLRCEDGLAPAYERRGSAGRSPYGGVLDIYVVECAGLEPVEIWMDMYHRHVEHSAVPGFTIVSPPDD